jgi:SAM-dependent methyltransferase
MRSVPKAPSVTTGLPLRVLRHLIVKHDIPIGSRVLDVGCGRGQLVQFLYELGFDVTGIDESQSAIEQARRAAPQLDLRHGRADELAPCRQHMFDIVLIRGLANYREDIFTEEAFQATANLLSCVRPGMLLIFLVKIGYPAWGQRAAHSVACYEQHLAAFPGRCETTGWPDSYMQPETWRSFLSGRRPAGYVTATLKIPPSPLSRDDWLQLADSATNSYRGRCCHNPNASYNSEPASLSAA